MFQVINKWIYRSSVRVIENDHVFKKYDWYFIAALPQTLAIYHMWLFKLIKN